MNFIFGKALLSLLFHTDNPYFFQIFIPTFLLMGTWKPVFLRVAILHKLYCIVLFIVYHNCGNIS